jgi:protein-serine/threonine kinase
MATRRPLPVPPGPPVTRYNQYTLSRPLDMYGPGNPYYTPYSYPDTYDEPPSTTLPGGTLLHKGFFDLLAMIPTPSPSRLLGWGPPPTQEPEPLLAGPRYEETTPGPRPVISNKPAPPPSSAFPLPTPAKKGRRISKDMVSKPTGFM